MSKVSFALFGIFLGACGGEDIVLPDGSLEDSETLGAPRCPFEAPPVSSTVEYDCNTPLAEENIDTCPYAESETQIVVSGTPDATESGVHIEVLNVSNQELASIYADVDGSFGLVMAGDVNDSLCLRVQKTGCNARRMWLLVRQCE